MVQRLNDSARLAAAAAERDRLHRLSPPQPLPDAAAAAAFVLERRIVTETAHAGVPVLAHAIAGREISGSWMAAPEVHRIHDLLRELTGFDLAWANLIDGKTTIFDPALTPAVHRIATDPGRCSRLVAQLPPVAARLYQRVRREGDVRMDQTGLSTKEGRAARLRLERLLLVTTVQIHTERGSHTVVVRPWSESSVARRAEAAGAGPGLAESIDLLLETAVRAAVVVPEGQARKWFDFGADRLEALVEQGRFDRLVTGPRQRWLLPARS